MRLAAILLSAFGALMLLFGTVTSSWFKVPEDDKRLATDRERPRSFSLRSAEVCETVDRGGSGLAGLLLDTGPIVSCRTVSYDDIGAADGESIAVMRITFALGLLGLLWLATSAILFGMGVRAERGFAIASILVCAACALAAIGVNVIRPRLLVELDAAIGSSFWLYMLGAILGANGGVCGTRLRRAPAPVDLLGDPREYFPPELAQPPAPGAPRTAIPSPIPLPSPPVEPRPCHRCGSSARWVPGYRRHWCDACTNWL